MVNRQRIGRRFHGAAATFVLLAAAAIHGDSGNTVVRVSTEAELQTAVQNIGSNTTVLIAPGVYQLSRALTINGAFTNVAIQGDGSTRDDVVLVGPGMTHASYGLVPYGIATGGGVNGVTIASLTIRDVYTYAIAFDSGTAHPHVDNVHLIDAGRAFIASNPNAGPAVDEGIVERSLIEYSRTADLGGTNGIDVRGGEGWIIRANVFRNIVGPSRQPAGASVLVRGQASGTVTDGNTFLNCWQGIAYGRDDADEPDHLGGIIRNNVFFRAADQPGDAGIVVANSPYTIVVNNTVFVSSTFGTPIVYQFAGTREGLVANNLLDGTIWARDGATGEEITNFTGATAALFADIASGDLHLAATAVGAIDRGTTIQAAFADIDGQTRPSGLAYDIGADEFEPGSPTFRLNKASSKGYFIGGQVTGSNGKGVADVTVTISEDRSAATTTDKRGIFSFTNLDPGGNFTLTPSASGARFTPSLRRYTWLPGYVTSADFKMTASSSVPAPSTPAPSAPAPSSPAPATPPTVSLTAPSDGARFTAPATISITADPSAGSGTVASVSFWAGSTLIGQDTRAPYSTTWTDVPAGSYELRAVVTNSGGATALSAPVNITVTAASQPAPAPVTANLTVVNGAGSGTYSVGAIVSIAATVPVGQQFVAWTGAAVQNAAVASTLLTMPATNTVATATFTPLTTGPAPAAPVATPAGGLVQSTGLVPIGTFRLPSGTLGSTWGFGSSAGCCGLGTYGVTFNPVRNSLYVGGHPYEQRLAEIAIPASFAGSPVATALSNLIDPLEGKLGSINPGDPNTKIIGGTLVFNGQLIVSGYSYYDGAGTQNASAFARPTDLTVRGQVVGPVKIGSQYPGWVDKFAALIPPEWQPNFNAPAFAGGAGGAINSLQSWGPSVSVFDPAMVARGGAVPATVVLGYPQAHPLADTSSGNPFWSQADVVTGVVAVPGTRSILFFGKHGMGAYCYGPGADCGDRDDSSKGTHAYPYRSQVWAYDMAELAAVKNGQKNSYDVKPYATWELDPGFKEIQGVAYDPATRHLFVSQVGGDSVNSGQPLIRVYAIQ